MSVFNFADHIEQQIAWSEATFGPRSERGPVGPLRHLLKELKEIEADPTDIMEWVDASFLVIDASWRAGSLVPGSAWKHLVSPRDNLLGVKSIAEDLIEFGAHRTMTYLDLLWSIMGSARYYGHTPEDLGAAMSVKLAINKMRSWPDWRAHPAGQPIEHVRTEPVPSTARDLAAIAAAIQPEQYRGPQSDLTPRPSSPWITPPRGEERANARRLLDQLWIAFTWEETSQGTSYWAEVASQLQALAGSE